MHLFQAGDENFVDKNPNVVMQLFAPIVTSQRIMSCQFGNSYTSIQCQDGTSMVFNEVSNLIAIFP
jgi:Hermansky-Pudlak syndrome 1 protein